VSIPDSDTLQVHACAPAYTYDMHQRALLESRERCAFAAVRSPDGSDVALRFAEPVQDLAEQRPRRRHARSGGWMGAYVGASWQATYAAGTTLSKLFAYRNPAVRGCEARGQ
jgi:hypothetical protein